MKILIVGAGPTGLTAAVELTRRGFKPRIIDRKEAPSPLSRAVGINARSLDILQESGITEKLLARGIKLQSVNIHENGKIIGAIHFKKLPHRHKFLLALPQNETEEIMSEALHKLGGKTEYHCALTSLKIEHGKAVVTINDGAPEIYDLVIGADGAHSKTREFCAIEFPGYDYPTRWSIADFESEDWQKDADLFLIPGGHVRFIVRIGKDRYRAVADQPEAIAGIPGPLHVDQLHRADSFVIAVRQATTYQKPPVYLAGDAAHVHSPAGGRGMNMGIEDAWDLARRIVENDLDGYTAARHPVGAHWLKLSERMVRGATATSPAGRFLRRLFLMIVSTFPVLQIPLLVRVSGLKN